jgi:hypothetical protein
MVKAPFRLKRFVPRIAPENFYFLFDANGNFLGNVLCYPEERDFIPEFGPGLRTWMAEILYSQKTARELLWELFATEEEALSWIALFCPDLFRDGRIWRMRPDWRRRVWSAMKDILGDNKPHDRMIVPFPVEEFTEILDEKLKEAERRGWHDRTRRLIPNLLVRA